MGSGSDVAGMSPPAGPYGNPATTSNGSSGLGEVNTDEIMTAMV